MPREILEPPLLENPGKSREAERSSPRLLYVTSGPGPRKVDSTVTGTHCDITADPFTQHRPPFTRLPPSGRILHHLVLFLNCTSCLHLAFGTILPASVSPMCGLHSGCGLVRANVA